MEVDAHPAQPERRRSPGRAGAPRRAARPAGDRVRRRRAGSSRRAAAAARTRAAARSTATGRAASPASTDRSNSPSDALVETSQRFTGWLLDPHPRGRRPVARSRGPGRRTGCPRTARPSPVPGLLRDHQHVHGPVELAGARGAGQRRRGRGPCRRATRREVGDASSPGSSATAGRSGSCRDERQVLGERVVRRLRRAATAPAPRRGRGTAARGAEHRTHPAASDMGSTLGFSRASRQAFQRRSVGDSCSQPRTETVAVSSWKCRPSETGSPSQRAASARRAWP